MNESADGLVEERIKQMFGEITPHALEDYIRNAEVFIFTLGVAPCFYDNATGKFVMPRSSALNARALAQKYTFRMTTVAENVANKKSILATVRSINPATKIILTVSPVPLNCIFEMNSPVQADCISKSILRLAVDEVLSDKAMAAYYWPSFEIVRWMSGHVGKFYGKDDGMSAHVNLEIVQYIIDDTFRVPE